MPADSNEPEEEIGLINGIVTAGTHRVEGKQFVFGVDGLKQLRGQLKVGEKNPKPKPSS